MNCDTFQIQCHIRSECDFTCLNESNTQLDNTIDYTNHSKYIFPWCGICSMFCFCEWPIVSIVCEYSFPIVVEDGGIVFGLFCADRCCVHALIVVIQQHAGTSLTGFPGWRFEMKSDAEKVWLFSEKFCGSATNLLNSWVSKYMG